MRMRFVLIVAATMSATAAHAGSQSSNTSSNSSSNNGVVRERIVDSYCEDGYCDRSIVRRVYRDDRPKHRAYARRDRYDDGDSRYGGFRGNRDDYYSYRQDRDDDDDD